MSQLNVMNRTIHRELHLFGTFAEISVMNQSRIKATARIRLPEVFLASGQPVFFFVHPLFHVLCFACECFYVEAFLARPIVSIRDTSLMRGGG